MAVMTITTTAGEDARLLVAFGAKLNLGGPANAAQIKADVAAYVRQVVTDQERIAAGLTANQTPISPT